jgi:uncharacterized protein
MVPGVLKPFIIPIKGLQIGSHHYKFDIDDKFLTTFESNLIKDGSFEVEVEVEKSHDFYFLHFDILGSIATDCDRCLTSINLPIEGNYKVMLKLSEQHQDDDAEIIYITPDDAEYNIAHLVNEYIQLSLPYNNTYDCENDAIPPCDFNLLDKIAQNNIMAAEEEIKEEKENSIWNDLKNKLKE